jgi:hypothetical protein
MVSLRDALLAVAFCSVVFLSTGFLALTMYMNRQWNRDAAAEEARQPKTPSSRP